MEGVAVGIEVHVVEVDDRPDLVAEERQSISKPVPNRIPSNSSEVPSANDARSPSTDVSHGRTVIRPSATSGRYCWARVTPAANSDGSGAGAPYCSGLPPASTTISFSCRSTSAGGSVSFARVPYRVKIR